LSSPVAVRTRTADPAREADRDRADGQERGLGERAPRRSLGFGERALDLDELCDRPRPRRRLVLVHVAPLA